MGGGMDGWLFNKQANYDHQWFALKPQVMREFHQ